VLQLSRRKKNKSKTYQKQQKYYSYQTKDPMQVKEIALKVFGSLYYNPKQDSI
jgi:hypothetical protein